LPILGAIFLAALNDENLRATSAKYRCHFRIFGDWNFSGIWRLVVPIIGFEASRPARPLPNFPLASQIHFASLNPPEKRFLQPIYEKISR
jgi:hypothetical protein